MDPLDRLQSRRNGSVPTVCLLVGPPGLGMERWRRWASRQDRPVAQATSPDELDERWLAAAAGRFDLARAAAVFLGRAVQREPEALLAMTGHDLEQLCRRAAAPGLGLRACRALLQGRGRDLREVLGRALAPEEIVAAVAELLPPERAAAWLLSVRAGPELARALSALEPRLARCPRLPAAVAVSAEVFAAFASQERPTSRLLTLAREGWVGIEGLSEPQLASRLQRVEPKPKPRALQRLVEDGVDEALADSYARAARAVRQEPLDPGQARSMAEQFLFDRLQSLPETAGRFALNVPLEFHHGPRPAEADLLAAEHRLVIEVDGAAFHLEPEQYRRDRRKDWLLQQHGYRVLRVLAEDVVDRLDEILDTVCQALRLPPHRPASPPWTPDG